MQKTILSLFTALIFLVVWSCSNSNEKIVIQRESMYYMPHLGQMMLTNQIYHTKLYYAGSEQNWDLTESIPTN